MLNWKQPLGSFLWWDFCSKICFREASTFAADALFIHQFFISACLLVLASNIPKYLCTIAMICLCVKWIYNVHIYITQNIGISKLEKYVTTSLFRYETLYYLWVKEVKAQGREIHILSILAFSSAPPNTCGTRRKGLREQSKTNRLPRRQVSSQPTGALGNAEHLVIAIALRSTLVRSGSKW